MKRYIIRLAGLLLVLSLIVANGAVAQTKSIPVDPNVPHFITLRSSGKGIISGESNVNVNGQGEVIKINTVKSVDLPHGSSINLTATPEKGWNLLRVTAKETLEAEVETELEVSAEGTLTYLLERNTVIYAYFEEIKPDTIIVEQEDLVIGSDEPSQLEHLEISGKTGEDSTTVTLKNVTVQLPDQEATTEVTEDSNVILELEGMVSLDKIENNGNLIIRNTNDGQAELKYNTVENKGVFVDETGMVTNVSGEAALEIVPLEDLLVEDGSSVTLTAEANPCEGYHLTFLWERFLDNTWEQVGEPDIQVDETVSTLRLANSVTSQLTVSSAEVGLYRCTITNKVEDVVTVLRTFAEVNLKSDPIIPDPTPTPEVYTITLPVVEGVTLSALGSTSVEEGGSFSFTVAITEGFNADDMIIKANGAVLTPNADGSYTISNVTGDVAITISGVIKEDNPTDIESVEGTALKVCSADGKLYIRSPKAQTAYIVTFGGQIYKELPVNVGETALTMPQGAYIIYIGKQSYKLRF
uniref:hypothetical protein n=1 Tax=Parabacteroides distasonis TaxID=823 RepID=UPI0040290267